MSRKGLMAALIASLAVNLFVIGLVAGIALMGLRIVGWGRQGGGGVGLMHGPMAAAAAGLSPDRRTAWEQTMREQALTSGPKVRQARILRRDAWNELAGDPLDPQAVLASLDQSRMLEQQARAEMDAAIVKFAASLPPDERHRLAQGLARPRSRSWSGGARPGDDGGASMRDRGAGPQPGPPGGAAGLPDR
jgi:uncharacterized membrane protein